MEAKRSESVTWRGGDAATPSRAGYCLPRAAGLGPPVAPLRGGGTGTARHGAPPPAALRPAPQPELRSPAPSRAKRRPAPVGLNGTATAALIEKSLSLKSLQNQFLYKRIKSKLDTNSKISVEILSKTGYSIRSHSKTGRVAEPARGLAEQSV